MQACKMSISLDPELGAAVRAAAAATSKSVSAWLSEAAVRKLRAEALARFLGDWEAEHGALTAAEIAEAEQELAFGPSCNPVR
jgi:hypothetical protein